MILKVLVQGTLSVTTEANTDIMQVHGAVRV